VERCHAPPTSSPLPRNEELGTNPCAGGAEVPRGTSGSIEVVLGGGKEKKFIVSPWPIQGK